MQLDEGGNPLNCLDLLKEAFLLKILIQNEFLGGNISWRVGFYEAFYRNGYDMCLIKIKVGRDSFPECG